MTDLQTDLAAVLGLVAEMETTQRACSEVSDEKLYRQVSDDCLEASSNFRIAAQVFFQNHGPAIAALSEHPDTARLRELLLSGASNEGRQKIFDCTVEAIAGNNPTLDEWRAAIDEAIRIKSTLP